MKKSNFKLDIVILSYNVSGQLKDCLKSLFEDPESSDWKVWVIDNASSDDSVKMVKKDFPVVELIESPVNVGFSAGNNLARDRVVSDVVLFLNPDTIVPVGTIGEIYRQLVDDSTIGAITCRVELPDGNLDDGCHRGFPNPWNAICHFGGLSKIFPQSRIFSGYSLGYKDLATRHEIDSLTGAFMMISKRMADSAGWWDEDYFWNGEDLDFCFRIKKLGFKIIYDPIVKIIHYKGSSAGYKKTSHNQNVSKEVKLMAAKASTQAMRIFYQKHYKQKYPGIVWKLVMMGIDVLEKKRIKTVEDSFKN